MSKGIIRKLDQLGRITLPIELRRSVNAGVKEPLDLFLDGSVIHLKKGTGRKLDELGRYTIPSEIRNTFGYAERQELDIYVEGAEICIRKESNACAVCGRDEVLLELHEVGEAHICKKCALVVMDMVMEKGL